MQLESPDSSSPLVTRAVAAGLAGERHATYSLEPWQRILLRVLGYLPQNLARFSISRFQALSGLEPNLLANLSLDQVISNRLQDYANIKGQFETITIGAALGGASAHLALSLRSLFLPVAFVFTLKGGALDGNANVYFHRSAELALHIADKNPEIVTIQHFDPVHDGWLTRYANHLRLKLIDLPSAYKQFIKRHLKIQGTICYLDCTAQWLRYRVGERSYFQVGGWGDISAQEFLEGSHRVDHYRQSTNLSGDNWQLDGYTLEAGSESEWGCENQVVHVLQDFCNQEGYRFVHVSYPEPHDYSKLAYRAVARQLEKEDHQPLGVLIEMFNQFDASAVIQTGLLPFWLVYNTSDSLAFLREMRSSFPAGKPVFFSPLGTYSITPDIVPWEEWVYTLQDTDWINIGTRPSHYPADPWTLLGWEKPLWEWVERNHCPIRGTLDPGELHML
jgi:hypothetical protein